MKTDYAGYYPSPVGTIKVTYSAKGISSLVFLDVKKKPARDDLFLESCFTQLDAYFSGELRCFELELDLAGTPFQKQVWDHLLTIPYGHTTTYQEVAQQINIPGSTRAVGHANGKNPVSIVVPCHRVIGSNGSLIGYAGGLWRKQWLLDHELKCKQLSLFD